MNAQDSHIVVIIFVSISITTTTAAVSMFGTAVATTILFVPHPRCGVVRF